jgi:hypothetical protein
LLFKDHIDLLCREHAIVLGKPLPLRHRDDPLTGRSIASPMSYSMLSYFCALRDIGRLVVELDDGPLEREAVAWQWAVDTAIARPDLDVRWMICAQLWRYLARARELDWALPRPESPYWDLMAWWE